ncbi:XdhC family protein [Rhizobium leguminosarum]|uniref:XdhC family protein n=1 Tax=Rhizobium leguminosarum TaxID=384 RepID=UPI0013C0F4E5|nr:XdhC family protein [Rhizobium leguminosarum]NEH97717.1 XdhC family protein [Rhizobium leguminosarum]NEJ44456.1 XdhC family protein [Rhizobium leguminosarum]NEJ54147.1 XdhC family protein [Rhizobium leguminosarum]NEJ82713.1 XdhC family protein [Rhizobium leguminosarum]
MLVVSQADFPIDALCRDDIALAVIVGTEGPAYRSPGTTMVVVDTGERIGSLSSGCIERDVGIHSQEALRTGLVRQLRYGRGSPWADIVLPCGGGLDILILPRPDRAVLDWAAGELSARNPVTLAIDTNNGVLRRHAAPGDLALKVLPELRFVVFGKGLEARTFAETADRIGYRVELFSPDEEALRETGQLAKRYMSAPRWPEELAIDGQTAITLFFHDHDWEPPLLQSALKTTAFYIGAQGSRRAAAARKQALFELGVPEEELKRMREPFGLIPSVRDPRTLAVSVLADVLAQAETNFKTKVHS